MNPTKTKIPTGWALAALALCLAPAARPETAPGTAKPVPVDADASRRADQRYEEMLGRMQAAIEEIAQLYGNPEFLQVFTNDPPRAAELKERLAAVRSGQEAERAEAQMKQRREELMADIALKERESQRLSGRLARQRVALDTLSSAVEQARKAVEDSSQ